MTTKKPKVSLTFASHHLAKRQRMKPYAVRRVEVMVPVGSGESIEKTMERLSEIFKGGPFPVFSLSVTHADIKDKGGKLFPSIVGCGRLPTVWTKSIR